MRPCAAPAVRWGLTALILGCAAAAAQEVTTVRISQAQARLPEVVAYLDATDVDGNPVQTLDQVTATLQEQSLQLQGVVPFAESGEGIAYLFLLDISKSLRANEFDPIRAAIERWVLDLNSNDRVAIMSFGDSAQLVQDYTNDQTELRSTLESLGPTDLNTQFHLALRSALEVSRRQDTDLPTRRVIVILSDGKDEGSGLTEEDVVSLLNEEPMPIYAIGYSRLARADRNRYLGVLRRFAELSGGIFFEGSADSLDQTYDRIRQAISRVFVARFTCAECQPDGRTHPLVVNAAVGGRVFEPNLNVRAVAGAVEPEPVPPTLPPSNRSWWLLILAAGLALLGLIGWWLWSRRESEVDDEPSVEASSFDSSEAAEQELAPAPAAAQPGPAPAPSRAVQLIVVHGRAAGQTYDVQLAERCVVGTEPGSDLVLYEEGVEGHHFELVAEGAKMWIRDLTRQRRTSVNGVPIAGSFQLESGDLVLAGRTEMRVVFS